MNTDLADCFSIRVDRRKSAALKFRGAWLWQRVISFMPGRRLLIGKCNSKNQVLSPGWPRDLQSNGQSRLREPTRNRNRWQPPHVEWSRIPEQPEFCGTQRFWTGFEFCNDRSRHRSCRSYEHIHIRKY